MRLYLLRHAIAVDHGAPGYKENERPLTAEGKEQAKDIARGMNQLKLSFDFVFYSPLVRTVQTASPILEKISVHKSDPLDCLAPGGSFKDWVNSIDRVHRKGAENILLVGHEPSLSQFISILISGSDYSEVMMKKGSLCKLTLDRINLGKCASLHWLLTPKQLRLLNN